MDAETMPEKLRVIIVEPMPWFMQGIAHELAETEDIEVVACATKGTQAIELVRTHRPDAAVIAVQLPDMSGLRVLERIRDSNTPVILFTHDEAPETLLEAMVLGARSYLLKWDGDVGLPETVRRVAKGEYVMPPQSLQTFVEAVRAEMRNSARKQRGLLADREREVLTLISQGLRQAEIANRLNLAHSTVRGYCRTAYSKLGVKNQAAAVSEAIRRGLIPARND